MGFTTKEIITITLETWNEGGFEARCIGADGKKQYFMGSGEDTAINLCNFILFKTIGKTIGDLK